MKILKKVNIVDFPFQWADTENYRNSDANRKGIYLPDDDNSVEELILLFYTLFGNLKHNLLIYDKSWWNFCLDTWDPNTDGYNYDLKNKSEESRDYLEMLKEAGIEGGYTGCCKCENWDKYLPIILKCITSHIAPYSSRFCDVENEFFFYFHHTGSIGIYYKENKVTDEILRIADKEYEVVS